MNAVTVKVRCCICGSLFEPTHREPNYCGDECRWAEMLRIAIERDDARDADEAANKLPGP